MSKIRYTELFYSLQGEGRYTGTPSVFLRTFGCNLRCKKFGRHKSEVIEGPNPEVAEVIQHIDQYKTFDDLPLVVTGCDSYPSIYPEFKRFAVDDDCDDLAEKIIELLPHRRWMDEHLVITGGEPLLGWQRSYPQLLAHSKMSELKEITFETNGTQMLDAEFKNFLGEWLDEDFNREVTFSVSAKLSCSGERREDAIKPKVILDLQEVGFTYLKFVVANEDDVNEAIEATELYREAGFSGPVYLMPLGGVAEVYQLNNRAVAELALKNGLRYSDRLHIPIFGNAWST